MLPKKNVSTCTQVPSSFKMISRSNVQEHICIFIWGQGDISGWVDNHVKY